MSCYGKGTGLKSHESHLSIQFKEEDLIAGYEADGNWVSLDQWHHDAQQPPNTWEAWVFHQRNYLITLSHLKKLYYYLSRNAPIGWDPARFGPWEDGGLWVLLARKMTSRHRSTSNYNVVVCYRPTTMETIYEDDDMSGFKLLQKMTHHTINECFFLGIRNWMHYPGQSGRLRYNKKIFSANGFNVKLRSRSIPGPLYDL